ncbi:MAG: alpha/beta fold hydrolase [Proteobacteria bacterium]|nr:alpha/beta fold hydrolase [Pseudomonadota bacterium]
MRRWMLLVAAVAACQWVCAAETPAAREGDFVLRNFKFQSGETLPEVRIHYHAFGKPGKDNTVLVMHGTGGSGASLIRPEFSGELFGPGQLLDASRYFIVLPDDIGHGKSSKPSDGLHAKFPHYGYNDMVEAEYRLLTEGFGVKHARLIMGTSMGCMHTWLWGEQHAEFMDALMPLACLPEQISGRNRVWRKVAADAIRNDPTWNGGEYKTQPAGLRTAIGMLWLVGSNPPLRQKEAPTFARANAVIDDYIATSLPHDDANDLIYQLESSYDYNPGPNLEKIRAPLFAVNSADDLVNPPELGILEKEIKRVPHGKAVVIPYSEHTRGHGSHTIAVLWKQYLQELLRSSDH